MRLRFSMRWLMVGFVIVAVVLGRVAYNVRRVEKERVGLTAFADDSFADGSHLALVEITPTLLSPPDDPVVFWAGSILGKQVTGVSITAKGGDPSQHPPPRSPNRSESFDRRAAQASRMLDESATLRVDGLTLHGLPLPASFGEARWLKDVLMLEASKASFQRMHFERFASLIELAADDSDFLHASAHGATFAALQVVELRNAAHIEPELIAALLGAPRLGAFHLTKKLAPGAARNPLQFFHQPFTDADLQPIRSEFLHDLQIGPIRIDGHGLRALHRCPGLDSVELLEVSGRGSLDDLLAHPSLEKLVLSGDLTNITLTRPAALGPALKTLDLAACTATQDVDAELARCCAARNITFTGASFIAPPAPAASPAPATSSAAAR